MKFINLNNDRYGIVEDDNAYIAKFLPIGTYELVRIESMAGENIYFQKIDDMKATEKIYGSHKDKCNMILESYNAMERSMGVILSGQKGSGKSLMLKMIARNSKLPVIVVRSYFPSLSSILDKITQECVIVFDEFEKNFSMLNKNDCDDESSTEQGNLLSMFDGLSSTKKLYVITCNNIRGINKYYFDRPGRFHYHITFTEPTIEEVIEYLADKVKSENMLPEKDIYALYNKYNMSYDILRAIAFEINMGRDIRKVIKDLNVSRRFGYSCYEARLELKDGRIFSDTIEFDVNACMVNNTRSDIYTEKYYTTIRGKDITYNAENKYFDVKLNSCKSNVFELEDIKSMKLIPVKTDNTDLLKLKVY